MSSVSQTTTDVPGLVLLPHYIENSSQQRLLAAVDASPWRGELRRRVQHYGFRYDYRSRSVGLEARLGPLPEWAAELAHQLASDTPVERVPDQLIVNEYRPGQGISAHVDCVRCFGNVVLSISLGSTCLMTFTEAATGKSVPVVVQPGTLMVMREDARYLWRHAIAARKSDVLDGRRVARGRRVSLTFRTVIVDGEALTQG